jgi:hypothetical protein
VVGEKTVGEIVGGRNVCVWLETLIGIVCVASEWGEVRNRQEAASNNKITIVPSSMSPLLIKNSVTRMKDRSIV